MKKLPLFEKDFTPLEGCLPKRTNHGCMRCALHLGYVTKQTPAGEVISVRTNVMPLHIKGYGDKTLLVVLDQPSEQEMDTLKAGGDSRYRWLLHQLRQNWTGAIVIDFAKRCHASERVKEATPLYQRKKWVSSCRPHLSQAYKIMSYDRVICLGQEAYYAVTDRWINPMDARRGYTHLQQKNVPVFLVQDYTGAMTNHFFKQWLVDDLKWATLAQYPNAKAEGFYFLINTPEDSAFAANLMREAGAFAFDCEWAGAPYNTDFTLMSVALCAKGSTDTYVWPFETLQEKRGPLNRDLVTILEDPNIGKYGQYIKVDFHGVFCGLGAEPRGLQFDTQVGVKLLESEAASNLETSAERVGLGGHKGKMQDALVAARDRLSKSAQARLTELQTQEERALDQYHGNRRKVVRTTASFDFARDTIIEKLSVEKLKAIVDKRGSFQDQYAYGYVDPSIRDAYNSLDTFSTMRLGEQLEAKLHQDSEVSQVWDILMKPGIETLFKMERNGFPVDRRVLEENCVYFREEAETYRLRISRYGTLNPDSTRELGKFLFETLGLPFQGMTAEGEYKTDEETLKKLEGNHPIIADILEYKSISKFLGTYSEGFLRYVRDDGKVHGQVRPDGARSGRMSCVVAETRVHTLAGVKPVSNVKVGDLVLTHRGRYQRVTAHLNQGSQPVVEVTFTQGTSLICTLDHRLFTSEGDWITVEELQNEYQQNMDLQCRELSEGLEALPRHQIPIYFKGCEGTGDNGAQYTGSFEGTYACSRVHGFSEPTKVDRKGWSQESHEGKDRRKPSQLDWCCGGSQGVLNGAQERCTEVCTPLGIDRCSGGTRPARYVCSTSHRREPQEQSIRQPGSDNQTRTRTNTLLAGEGHSLYTVEKIYSRGTRQVFDLSVAGDESYLTNEVYSHNCTEPALQTVPSSEDSDKETGRRAIMVRRAFVALSGHVLLKFDYDQLEYRVAAWVSKDEFLKQGFVRKEDIHVIVTKAICKYMWGINPEDWDKQEKGTKKTQRKVGKTFAFALLFGMGDDNVALTLKITKEKAAEVREALMGNLKGYAAFQEWAEELTSETGYARTKWWDSSGKEVLFRKRQCQAIGSKDKKWNAYGRRVSTNSFIQGTASDLCLFAMIRIQGWLEEEGLDQQGVQLIMTIHDALFFHIPNHLVSYVAPIIKRFMEDYECGGVPITVSGDIGDNWGEMIEYRDEVGHYLQTKTYAQYLKTPEYKSWLESKK